MDMKELEATEQILEGRTEAIQPTALNQKKAGRKLKFTLFVISLITLAILGGFTLMYVQAQNYTTLILGLFTLLVVDVGTYQTLNVIQKNNIAKNYRPELDSARTSVLTQIERIADKTEEVIDNVAPVIQNFTEDGDDLEDPGDL